MTPFLSKRRRLKFFPYDHVSTFRSSFATTMLVSFSRAVGSCIVSYLFFRPMRWHRRGGVRERRMLQPLPQDPARHFLHTLRGQFRYPLRCFVSTPLISSLGARRALKDVHQCRMDVDSPGGVALAGYCLVSPSLRVVSP